MFFGRITKVGARCHEARHVFSRERAHFRRFMLKTEGTACACNALHMFVLSAENHRAGLFLADQDMPLPKGLQRKGQRTRAQRSVLAARALARRREAWTMLHGAVPEEIRNHLPENFDEASEFALQDMKTADERVRAIKACLSYCELHYGELIYPEEREKEPKEWDYSALRDVIFGRAAEQREVEIDAPDPKDDSDSDGADDDGAANIVASCLEPMETLQMGPSETPVV